MIRSTNAILDELKDLVKQRKEGSLTKDEGDVVFKRILLDLKAIHGEKNLYIQKLQENFKRASFRFQEIERLKTFFQGVKEEEYMLAKELGISF